MLRYFKYPCQDFINGCSKQMQDCKRKDKRPITSTQCKLGVFRHCICLVQNNKFHIHLWSAQLHDKFFTISVLHMIGLMKYARLKPGKRRCGLASAQTCFEEDEYIFLCDRIAKSTTINVISTATTPYEPKIGLT